MSNDVKFFETPCMTISQVSSVINLIPQNFSNTTEIAINTQHIEVNITLC